MSVLTGVVSVLVGGGLLAFIQFLINRHDNKHDKLKGITDSIEDVKRELKDIKDEIGKVRDEADQRDAVQARTHILRFRDELTNDIEHSQDYFDQILDDAKRYEDFCSTHPKFPNGRTDAAIQYIRDEHQRLLKEHKI